MGTATEDAETTTLGPTLDEAPDEPEAFAGGGSGTAVSTKGSPITRPAPLGGTNGFWKCL